MEKTSTVDWNEWTAVGTLILAGMTLLAIIVTMVITKGDRSRADTRSREDARRDAALADRAGLLAALRQAAMSYSECSTSALEDARHRAYGEWKVSIRSAQRTGAFPSLLLNDTELEVVGVMMRTKTSANHVFKDSVVEEIAQVIAKANGMTWQAYANQRNLPS